jgi:hypothetical protein
LYRFSENLALFAGVVLPLGETLRRWGVWWDAPMAYLDDIVVGAFFLFAAWASRSGEPTGARWLAAAFGFGCGMGYGSLAASVADIGSFDPSGVTGATAALVKAVMFALGVVGLAGALRGRST